MPESASQTPLPARMEAEFSHLLRELSASGHQASELIKQTRLPRWCRRSLFYFLGYIAKAEGRVTEQDIGFAETLITALRLSQRQRQKAIQHFQNGKNAETIPTAKALRLKLSHRLWPSASLRVAICLCHAAQLHGRPNKQRRYRCEDAVDQMGLPMVVCDDILDSYASKVWIAEPESESAPKTFEEACQVLGVTRRDSRDVMKRAYRKKVSEYHPDKLAQRDLSNREMAQAKDRLLRFQQAWELIDRRYPG